MIHMTKLETFRFDYEYEFDYDYEYDFLAFELVMLTTCLRVSAILLANKWMATKFDVTVILVIPVKNFQGKPKVLVSS